jgi:hypothetical protein
MTATKLSDFNPDYARGEESPDPESWRINDLLVK